MDFLELLQEEAPSFAGYMDIKEIMRLYYGRLGMYVSFSNDEKLDMSGFDASDLNRPYAVKAYTVDTVVGRKVFSAKFYGHVFRIINKNRKFLNDIRDYTREDFIEDYEAMMLFPYLSTEEVYNARMIVDSNPRIRSAFQRFWEMVKLIVSSEGKLADKLWRRILLDLGYGGFTDQSGQGIMAKGKQTITLILDERDIEVYDIVPIQKFRVDKRQRVIDQINKKNKRMHARRNRVAKVKTEPTRGLVSTIKGFLR
jgi:hypothetical protein